MMDYLLTAVVPLALATCLLWGNQKVATQDGFMYKDYTTVLKGVCCIILISIPLANH